MDIKDTFLKLTSRTYPAGTEVEIFHLLPNDLNFDEFGNRFIQIGDEPSTMFTSHLDTATGANTQVVHTFDGNLIKTDGKSILGADDKAGVTIMLWMIKNQIPGLYYFFLAEEIGCVGSRKVAAVHKVNPIPHIKKVVSFDRRGTDSVITFQSTGRCCSDEFGSALSGQLNSAATELGFKFSYQNDPTGIYTDSAQFVTIYPECTNISVGYRSEHTFSESQDIDHLEKLAKAVCLVKWDELPISRDPSKVEYRSYGSWGAGAWGDDDYAYGYNTYKPAKTKYTDDHWFMDGDHVSVVTQNIYTKKVEKVDFSQERLDSELDLICQLLMALNISYKEVTWDGLNLDVAYKTAEHNSTCTRNDLVEFIPELDFWKDLLDEDEAKKPTAVDNDDIFPF